MTTEQMMLKIAQLRSKFANTDLATARISGKTCITGTKKGNVEVRYNKGQYMILDFNNTNFAHYVGRKQGAVDWLAENYEVIGG